MASQTPTKISTQDINQIILQILDCCNTIFFKSAALRLKDLSFRIHNNQIRIGVIGITSSGKSTLLNAILGKQLLPTRVGPSSGKQVLCGYDKVLHADIIFEEETRKKRLSITHNIPEGLQKYGDEKYNPHNREGVAEIHVFSPDFRFNHNLVFVDTPGLDAYGLGIHEAITLKLVLPTVDMIMFLTNVKCDSDRQNLDFIDRATSDTKPLIVVQNKIDSIEPKISTRGVEKTKSDVKMEHYNRIRHLLSLAQKQSVQKAPVIQISAKEKNWSQSNLESLKEVLNEQISLNQEYCSSRFIRQLSRELQGMIQALKNALAQSDQREKAYQTNFQKIKQWKEHCHNADQKYNDIQQYLQNRQNEITALVQTLLTTINDHYLVSPKKEATREKPQKHSSPPQSGNSILDFLCKHIISLAQKHISSSQDDEEHFSKLGDATYKNPKRLNTQIRSDKNQLKSLIESTTSQFSNDITELQQAIQISCEDLNLQESQVIRREILGSVTVSIPDYEETVRGKYHPAHVEWEKQDTIVGSIKRFVGSFLGTDWGLIKKVYTEYYEASTVYNIAKMIQSISDAYQNFMIFFEQKYTVFQKNTEYSLQCLHNELSRRELEIKEQFQIEISTTEGNDILRKLQNIIAANPVLQGEATPHDNLQNMKIKPVQIHTPEHYLDGQYSPLIVNTAVLSQNICLDIHRKLVQDLIHKSGMKEFHICGWDANRLEEFRNIFFRQSDKTAILDFTQSGLIYPSHSSLIFLLLNAEQTGSTENKLINSGRTSQFIREAASQGRIIWVMDSVREFISIQNPQEDSLIEAFIEMLGLISRFLHDSQTKLTDILVCDRELYYSVLLHELIFNLEMRKTEKNRQNFIREMQELFLLNSERVHATGQYVNKFLNSLRNAPDLIDIVKTN